MLRIALFLAFLALSGCTDQCRAKGWGGSAQTDLPCGQKLVVMTWKNDDLWFLTRPMRPGEKAETYTFVESSSFGVLEGTITVVECGSGPTGGW